MTRFQVQADENADRNAADLRALPTGRIRPVMKSLGQQQLLPPAMAIAHRHGETVERS
jgi:hypothetical protein